MAPENNYEQEIQNINRSIDALAKSTNKAQDETSHFSAAVATASAVVASGVDTTKELTQIVDNLRKHTLVRATAGFLTFSNAVNSFAQSAPKLLSRQFEGAFQTVGKFENSIANANQRLMQMGGSMTSIQDVNKKYNDSIQRINDNTKLTLQQSESLYTSITQGMKGVADSSGEAVGELEKVIINTSKMGLTFEETSKSLDKFIGVTQRYNQVRRAMAEGNIEAIKGQLLALYSTGQLSQDAIREMSAVQTATARSGMISEINETVRPAAEMAASTAQAQEDAMFALQTEETKRDLAKYHMEASKWAADVQKRWAAQLSYLSVITKTLNEVAAGVSILAGGVSLGASAISSKVLGQNGGKAVGALAKGAAIAAPLVGGRVGAGLGVLGAMSGEVTPVYVVNMPGAGALGGTAGSLLSGAGASAAASKARQVAKAGGSVLTTPLTLAGLGGAGKSAIGLARSGTAAAYGGLKGIGGRAISLGGSLGGAALGIGAITEASMEYGGPVLDAFNFYTGGNLQSRKAMEDSMARDEMNNQTQENRTNRLKAFQQNYELVKKFGDKERAEELRQKYSGIIKTGGTEAVGRGPARQIAKELEEEANKLREIYNMQMSFVEATSKAEFGIAEIVSKLEEARKETELGAQSANLMFESFSNAASMVKNIVGFADMEAQFLRASASAAQDKAAVSKAQIPILEQSVENEKESLETAKAALQEALKKRSVDKSSVSDEDLKKLEEGVANAQKNVQAAQGALRVQQNDVQKSILESFQLEADAVSAPFEQARQVQEQNINLSEAMLERNKALRQGIGTNYEDTVRVVNEMQKQVQIINQEADARAKNAEKLRGISEDETKSAEERENAERMAVAEELKVAQLRTEATRTETQMLEASKAIREGYLDALESTVANMGAYAKILPGRGFGNQYFASTFSLGAQAGTMTPGGNLMTGTNNPMLQTINGLSGNIQELNRVMEDFKLVSGKNPRAIQAGFYGEEGQFYTSGGALSAAGKGRSNIRMNNLGDPNNPVTPSGVRVSLADREYPVTQGSPSFYGSPSDITVTVRFEAPNGKQLGAITTVSGGSTSMPTAPSPGSVGTSG